MDDIEASKEFFDKKMEPLETAKMLQQVIQDNGWNQKEAAKKLNKSESWISRKLALLSDEKRFEEELSGRQKVDFGALKKQLIAKKDYNFYELPVNKLALLDVCKLISVLAERHGLALIEVEDDMPDEDVKKIIVQHVTEILHAEHPECF